MFIKFLAAAFISCTFFATIVHAKNIIAETTNSLKLKSQILKSTGLVEGDYVLSSGDKRCLTGSLYFYELSDRATLMLGSHALVTSLGKNNYSNVDGDCKSKITTSLAKGKITWAKTETCNQNVTHYKTVVTFNDNLLKYTKDINGPFGKTSMNCQLVLSK